MKRFLILMSIVSVNNVFAQTENASSDYSEEDLYQFMQMVVTTQNLNKTYALAYKTDANKYEWSFFSEYTLDSTSLEAALAFDSIQKARGTLLANPYYKDGLTPKDIESFLQNGKNVNPVYKWKDDAFDFDQTNRKDWYTFTLPVFNSDKTMALVTIRYTCSEFLCGNTQYFLYKKVNGEWTGKALSLWLN